MVNFIFSVVVAALGLTSAWLLGHDKPVGWYIIIAVQVMWWPYIFSNDLYGLFASNVVYIVLGVRNVRLSAGRRRRTQRQDQQSQRRCHCADAVEEL